MKPSKSIINLHNSSKGQGNTRDLVDRISALPDSILGLILSNLPTKNAVATTILSKRWKFLWMTAHNLDFCLEDWKSQIPAEGDMKLIQCVNHVLPLYNNGLLNKFRLVWKTYFISFQISSWVTFAITRNVHELYLCVGTSWDELALPISLFSCESLQCLELDGSFYVSASAVVSLPRLESLKLISVEFQSKETLQELISGGCPMLKYLHIDLDILMFTRDFEEDDVFTYRISSPSLRRLEIYDSLYFLKLIRRLELVDSSLEYIKLDGPIHEVFVQRRNLSSLVEADLDIFLLEHNEYSHNLLVKELRSFDCAKTLTLSALIMWALSNATIPLATTFKRLTKLNAHVGCCYCSSLQDVIQSSNSLEVLTIVKEPCDLSIFSHDHSNWTSPVEVPQCLSNSLKEVSFEGYNGCDDELEMIVYLLQHGTALEVMQVNCLNKKRKRKGKNMELLKEICRFPRKSPACKVEFID